MADVRLTATNPEDSSVVPVACNEKGELKLEEIPDQSFDGNLQGDLTVFGSATFAGGVSANFVNCVTDADKFNYFANAGDYTNLNTAFADKDGTQGVKIFNNGSADFAGTVQSRRLDVYSNNVVLAGYDVNNARNVIIYPNGDFQIGGSLGNTAENNAPNIALNSDGSAEFAGFVRAGTVSTGGGVNFAGGKAGFTAEGYLWCTTRRGDTVILDATSNGLASWVSYTPPNRLTQLQDKLAELKPGPPTDIDSSRLTKD